ncbi:hypothetical protein FRUB_10418 [Fimbriiglobus ruber]|uniref:Uncharacterized protein n=1 Tax=Fimbriiglobus ruber TaxID=1908690 RepID=A0A225DE94_9BACT|nr:hypothetical protein FRUB_10418 [Fimbriiglobus ruber]
MTLTADGWRADFSDLASFSVITDCCELLGILRPEMKKPQFQRVRCFILGLA